MTGVREPTVQQLDPLGGLGARRISILVVLTACGYAILADILSFGAIVRLDFAALAVLFLVGSGIVLTVGSSPFRAPLTQRGHALIHGLAFGAAVLSAASRWGDAADFKDDWGPISLGLILVAIAPFRPALELAALSALSAIGVGFVAMMRAQELDTVVPLVAYAVFTATPILAMAWAAAAFSANVVRSLEDWHARAHEAARSSVSGLQERIARSVRQERLTILSRDVMPFFANLLDRGEIRPSDREKARLIAESIRALMVAEVDRSWLDRAVDVQSDGSPITAGTPNEVKDDGALAQFMTTGQRTALRALVGAMLSAPAFLPGSLKITIVDSEGMCRTELVGTIVSARRATRSMLTPYFAVMRLAFHDLQVDFLTTTLTVRFSYDRF